MSVDDDTERFLTYAREIREQGVFFKPHDFWYLTYPLFIILMTSIHDSLGAIVLGQVLLSYVALVSLYFSAIRLFQNPKAGLTTGFLFLGFVMVSFWNFWIYCESLLISLNCLAFYFLIKWIKGERSMWEIGLGVLIMLAAFFTKPTGIALLAGLMGVMGYYLWSNEQVKKFRWWGLGIFIFLFHFLLNRMLATFGFVDAYQLGEVVYNIHKLSHMDYAHWLLVDVPGDLFIPDADYPSLVQFVLLVFGNPIYSLRLFGTKLFFYLLYIRPYYSLWHNALALLFLLPVYYVFVKEMRRELLDRAIKIFIGLFCVVSILSATLLTINWNSRFLVVVLPLVFLIGGNQLSRVFSIKAQATKLF